MNNWLTCMRALLDMMRSHVNLESYVGKHTSRSTISSLPDEIIVDILCRVPAESVLACSAVCSSWYRITNTPYFSETHLNRSSPVIFGRVLDVDCENQCWFFITDFKSEAMFRRVEVTSLEYVRHGFRSCVRSSCDGLLIFEYEPNSYMICNPVTREQIVFSLRVDDEICGFFSHGLEKEYKLLIYQKNDKNKYSLFGLSDKYRRTLPTYADFKFQGSGVVAGGALFWRNTGIKQNGVTIKTEDIVMFDFDSENFVVKTQPADRCERDGRQDVKLLQIEGKLGCCDVYAKLVRVWILEDIKNWKWVKRYVVDLGGYIIDHGDSYKSDAKTFVLGIQNKNLLIFQNFVGLMWCNLRLNVVSLINTGKTNLLGKYISIYATQYTSSMISLQECNIFPPSP